MSLPVGTILAVCSRVRAYGVEQVLNRVKKLMTGSDMGNVVRVRSALHQLMREGFVVMECSRSGRVSWRLTDKGYERLKTGEVATSLEGYNALPHAGYPAPL